MTKCIYKEFQDYFFINNIFMNVFIKKKFLNDSNQYILYTTKISTEKKSLRKQEKTT